MHPGIGPIEYQQHHPPRPGPGNAHVPSEGGDARGRSLGVCLCTCDVGQGGESGSGSPRDVVSAAERQSLNAVAQC